MTKLIFFELNEVPIRIVDYFRSARPSSWIAKNYKKLRKFTTVSENRGHLSPWNTWPTVHRGVSNDRHFIADFNQDLSEVDREFPPIWQLLSQSGIRTGLFGSLHSYPLPQDLSGYDFYIPDVFAAGSECFPDNLEVFQEINLRLSRGSARNVDPGVPYAEVLKRLPAFSGLGFRLGTIADVGGQIVQEKLDPWKTIRRRTYQSVLAFDVFYKLLRDRQPDFVTFFTNHVASSMHRYWAAAFPDHYENLRYDREWIETYDDEILFAMGKADKMLERLGRFVDRHPQYKLLVTSSMGQHAIECEPVETQLYIVDHDRFMSMLGMEPGEYDILPAMLPQFNYAVRGAKTSLFENNLRQLRVNGQVVGYRRHDGGSFSIDLGHSNLKEAVISLAGRSISLAESGLRNVVIEDKSSSTAYHIPEGHLFSYHPSHRDQPLGEDQLPTTEIAPMVLHNFGVSIPVHMKASTMGDHGPL